MSQYIEESNFDSNLRLGDIINGFSHITPKFDDFINKGSEFTLDIKHQSFFSILTPCCSIEEQLITLVPLKQIRSSLLTNSFYKEDFTRINRPIPQYRSYPENAWNNFDENKKNEIMSKEDGYSLFELFLYGPNEKLPEYQIRYKNILGESIGTYMIDFKETFTISSKKIQRGNSYPKILQLSISSRGELRNKLAYFFNRIPEEDNIIE